MERSKVRVGVQGRQSRLVAPEAAGGRSHNARGLPVTGELATRQSRSVGRGGSPNARGLPIAWSGVEICSPCHPSCRSSRGGRPIETQASGGPRAPRCVAVAGRSPVASSRGWEPSWGYFRHSPVPAGRGPREPTGRSPSPIHPPNGGSGTPALASHPPIRPPQPVRELHPRPSSRLFGRTDRLGAVAGSAGLERGWLLRGGTVARPRTAVRHRTRRQHRGGHHHRRRRLGLSGRHRGVVVGGVRRGGHPGARALGGAAHLGDRARPRPPHPGRLPRRPLRSLGAPRHRDAPLAGHARAAGRSAHRDGRRLRGRGRVAAGVGGGGGRGGGNRVLRRRRPRGGCVGEPGAAGRDGRGVRDRPPLGGGGRGWMGGGGRRRPSRGPRLLAGRRIRLDLPRAGRARLRHLPRPHPEGLRCGGRPRHPRWSRGHRGRPPPVRRRPSAVGDGSARVRSGAGRPRARPAARAHGGRAPVARHAGPRGRPVGGAQLLGRHPLHALDLPLARPVPSLRPPGRLRRVRPAGRARRGARRGRAGHPPGRRPPRRHRRPDHLLRPPRRQPLRARVGRPVRAPAPGRPKRSPQSVSG